MCVCVCVCVCACVRVRAYVRVCVRVRGCGALIRFLVLSLSPVLFFLQCVFAHTGVSQAFFHTVATIFCEFWLHCPINSFERPKNMRF